jgi:Xaa-Pro aminopeptidase
MVFTQRLPAAFFTAVQADIRARLAVAGFTAGIFDDPDDVAYLTGFFHFPNERPVAVWLAVGDSGPPVLLVPELEREYAQHQQAAAELVSYPEFPGVRPPFTVLAAQVGAGSASVGYGDATTTGRLAAMQAAFSGATFGRTDAVQMARLVKRPEEIALHHEAARITDLMLEAGRSCVEQAVREQANLPTEAELAALVSQAGTAIMYAEHDDVVVVPHLAGGLVYCGPNSARPHALPSGRRLAPGEPFMLSLGAGVGGRHVECERTFFLGEPDAKQARYYATVLAAQQAGLAGLRAGRRCCDVNAECLAVIRDAGLAHYLRHRQGHGIGINIHEPPWLEDGDDSELAEAMIVSDEPGLYVPGLGGFRISDSVLVGSGDGEPLTAYPKNLDDVVIPV